MFKDPFNFKDPLAMFDRCENCQQRFEPEPGFYFGAMFVSYIISGFTILIPGLILVFYFKWSLEATMALILFFAVITFFKLMRFSRSVWIHLIVKYDPKRSQT